MVFLTVCRYGARSRKKTFVDNVRVYVRGGPGGQGLPRYGGLGGRGGSIYVKAEERATLKQLTSKRRYIGGTGENSRVRALAGAAGNSVEILVPPGVQVENDAGRTLGEVNEEGERVLVARGGAGGGPANNFIGQRGVPFHIRLNLKLIADVGLVGFPNAGKSTLLSAISRATPKIASYPFTTVQPQLGMIGYDDCRQVSVADLPGLIEGAHLNVGMGHRFLKHVERTKMLLFVVDMHGFRLDLKSPPRTAIETVLLLNKELELYRPDLISKPCMLAINKIDIDHCEDDLQAIVEQVKRLSATTCHGLPPELLPTQFVTFDHVIPISAKRQQSVEQLKEKVRSLLDVYADRERLLQSEASELQLSAGESGVINSRGGEGGHAVPAAQSDRTSRTFLV